MVKAFGVVVLVLVLVAGVAHFTGAVDFGFSAEVTDHGKDMADSGISKVQDGMNQGLDALKPDQK